MRFLEEVIDRRIDQNPPFAIMRRVFAFDPFGALVLYGCHQLPWDYQSRPGLLEFARDVIDDAVRSEAVRRGYASE